MNFISSKTLIILALTFVFFSGVYAQNQQTDNEFVQAMSFVNSGKLGSALPLLEKLATRYPNDAEIQAHLGVSILATSSTLKDSESRKKEVARGGEFLKKAQKLGTKNVLALHYLDLINQGLEIDSVSNSANKDVEEAIREGEGYFGKGDYNKAFASYEKAHKLDPQNYDAALFAGDCFYAQKNYVEAEVWFAKAVKINPNREQAFRFWGDALANQNKGEQALEKFAYAYIAEPTSRIAVNSFFEGIKNFGKRRSLPFVSIPAKESEEIVIDETVLKSDDGTIAWKSFTKTRTEQIAKFNTVANGREFISTVAEDVTALKSVALAANDWQQNNKSLPLDKSLTNLIKLDNLGMLDIYTIFFLHGADSSPEYESFRENNRERMFKFLVGYFANDSL